MDTRADSCSTHGDFLFEDIQPVAQAGRVLLRDGEDAMTALGAAGAAHEMMSAAFDSGCERSVYDLNERWCFRVQGHSIRLRRRWNLRGDD